MTDPQYSPPPSSTPYVPAGGVATQKKGFSITALILGIVSFLLILTTWPATLVGIAAVVFGFVARGREPYAKGLWLTGLILGAVAVVLSILWLIAVFAIAASLPPSAYTTTG